MNKEILFRGKRVDNNEWVFGDLIASKNKYYIHPQGNSFQVDGVLSRLIVLHEVKSETVGQFTGLTDKNGKKIFENDIIADDEEYSTFENTRKGIVKFYHGEFTSFYGQDLLGRDCYDPLYSVCKERYVIGNIYDNPELEEE